MFEGRSRNTVSRSPATVPGGTVLEVSRLETGWNESVEQLVILGPLLEVITASGKVVIGSTASLKPMFEVNAYASTFVTLQVSC